ncbi:MAG: hypothetical protein JXA41_13525 [Deltaproteobacteria bacterium]|nr:hypothetical protein [Deltaproteobacteria bacterium]
MAHHHTIKSDGCDGLAKRLNILPQGAPPTEFLFKIFKVLFYEREAKLVSSLPVKPKN